MARFLLLPLLFGCVLGGVDGGGDDKEADADTDADTDTDTDTDVDLGPCPAYSGLIAQGHVWEWRYSDDQAEVAGAGEWTTTLTTLGADGTWSIDTSGSYAVEGFDYYRIDYVQTGACDVEGAWLEEARSNVAFSLGGNARTQASTTTYATPYLIMPAGVTEGGSWTIDVEGTTESDVAPTSSFAYTLTLRAVGVEDVSVPAGDFSAMKFTSTSEFGSTAYWAHTSLGSVETEGAELVAYY